jgi:hypothetical protein
MVAGFITTYATSAYHHQRCEFEYKNYILNIVCACLVCAAVGYMVMVLNTTFNNISVISVLPGQNH